MLVLLCGVWIITCTQLEYASAAWTLIGRYGGGTVSLKELNGNEVHNPENVLTLAPGPHQHFDNLDLWFESTVSFRCSKQACMY